MRRIFAVAAVFISSQLLAQQDTTQSLEEVTVTATKYSTKTTETGKVVTVITRQDIEHAGSRDLSQVITELGGVFINGYTNNAGKEKNVYVRGAKVDYTLITIDGIPVYDASGIGSNFDIRYIPIDNVERIEILKGSQSTLYGSDAIAGVINIITRKAGAKPFSAFATAHYGSFDTRRLNAGINGKSGVFDYNIGYTHFKTDGFSEAQQAATASSVFDKDSYQQNNMQSNFGIQVGKQLRVQPFIRYSNNKGGLDEGAFQDEMDFNYEAKNLQAGVKNTAQIGKAQLNALYQFNNTKRNYLDDSIETGGYYKYNQSAYTANEHFAEAFVIYPFTSVKLTAGTDFRSSNTDFSAIQKNIYSPLVDKPAFSGDSVKQNQVGVYAALNYLKNNFSVEGGGRFNNHSAYGNNFAFNINPSYFIQKKLKAFANFSSGYKTPSLYQLFSEYGNKDLKPETSINLEGGLHYFSTDEKINLRATYFNRRIKDAIAFFYDPATFRSNYINQDKQNDHGFELEGKAMIAEKIQLRLLYSYVNGKITTKQMGKDTSYFNLLRRPKSILNLSLGGQVTKAFYANAQFNGVGKSKDIYFDPVTFAQQDITLKKYVLVNFYAEYGFLDQRLKFFADLRNITNKKYSDIYGYNTAGFNAYGGFRFRL
jgi:vitamin B12 transporter